MRLGKFSSYYVFTELQKNHLNKISLSADQVGFVASP
jgi:hypothetical protein